MPIPLRAHPVPPSVTSQRTIPVTAAQSGPAAAAAALRLRLLVQRAAGRAGQPVHQPAAEQRAGRRRRPRPARRTRCPGRSPSTRPCADGLDAGPGPAHPGEPGGAGDRDRRGRGHARHARRQSAAIDVGYLDGVYAFSTQRAAPGRRDPHRPTRQPHGAGHRPAISPQPGSPATALARVRRRTPRAAAGPGPAHPGAPVVRPPPGSTAAWQALQVFTELAGPIAQAWAACLARAALPAAD